MADPIMQEVTALTSTEREHLFQWGRNIWGSHGIRRLQVRAPERRFIRYADVTHDEGVYTLPVSHVGVVETRAAAPGHAPYGIAGLGTIVTNGRLQRQGHARALIAFVLDRLRTEARADLALLFCLDHRRQFYLSAGWVPWPTRVTVAQPSLTAPGHETSVVVQSPYHVLYQPLGAVTLPTEGPLAIEGLPW